MLSKRLFALILLIVIIAKRKQALMLAEYLSYPWHSVCPIERYKSKGFVEEVPLSKRYPPLDREALMKYGVIRASRAVYHK